MPDTSSPLSRRGMRKLARMIGQATERAGRSFRLRQGYGPTGSASAASLPATRVQFGLGAVLQYSITPRGRIRGRGRGRSACDATARLAFLDRGTIFGKAYTFPMDKNTKIVVCGAGGFV